MPFLRHVCLISLVTLAPGLLELTTRVAAAEEKVAKPKAERQEPTQFLFFDWFHVQKGDLNVSLDPARLSAAGKKALETYKRDFNKVFPMEGHGFRPTDVPYGIRISQEVAERTQPWIKADQPWELSVNSPTVIFEDGKYRCWYLVRLVGTEEKVTVAEGQVMEVTGSALAYAESVDGIAWKKPILNILSFQGSKKNNLVSPFNNGGGVFRDDHGPAEERYKSFQFDELPEDQRGQGHLERYGLFGVTSPDGYHWVKSNKPLIRYFSDTQNVAAWDPLLKKYVGFFRHHLSGRTISRAETEDFWNWPAPQPLLYAGPLDAPADDFYTNGYTSYPGEPGLRLLFPGIYHRANDSVDVRLGVSRDGRAYQWVSYDPIIPLGKSGEVDGGSLYAHPNLVQLPDGRLALPFDSTNLTHNEAWFESFYEDYPQASAISWALWKEARLAGIEAESLGQFTTNALTIRGDRLQINARTTRGGSVEVELRRKGKAIEGFSFEECIPFTGDEISTDCQWKGQKTLESLRSQSVQLCVRLRSAKIFACRLVTDAK